MSPDVQRGDNSSLLLCFILSYLYLMQSVYVYTAQPPHIIARITQQTVIDQGQLMEHLTEDLSSIAMRIAADPVNGYIYMTDAARLKRCQTGT